MEYYHVFLTLPAPVSALACNNKSMIWSILFRAAVQTLRTIAADPKHLGARIGLTLVLHTWGSAMAHHPHVHGILPGGGLSLDGQRWIACRSGFFCRYASSHDCSTGCSLSNSLRRIATGNCSSWLNTKR